MSMARRFIRKTTSHKRIGECNMNQHEYHEKSEIIQNMTDEDAVFIARLQRKDRIKSLAIMMLLVIIPLTILFTLSAYNIGKEYLSCGFLSVFVLMHLYMMRGRFRRR
jgi:uncharacterized membrane protein